MMDISSRLVKRCRKFIEPYRVTDGRGFKLSRYDPGDLGKLGKDSKKEAVDKLEKGIELLEQLQEVLYASESHALLVVLQAMDSAGKDGIVKHVMGGVNPQGCVVSSFKQPSTLERSHDFLWRCVARLPRRGMIGIFNRSYYEEVLSVRVHPEFLAGEGFNPSHAKSAFWEERFRSINNLERHLLANRTSIVKIFLNLSPEEQRKRLLARLDTPDKNWKFSEGDIHEREFWDQYQKAYEEMIRHTSSREAPWYVVPADNKWYSRLVCLCAIVEALAEMRLEYPKVSGELKEFFPKFREELERPCPGAGIRAAFGNAERKTARQREIALLLLRRRIPCHWGRLRFRQRLRSQDCTLPLMKSTYPVFTGT